MTPEQIHSLFSGKEGSKEISGLTTINVVAGICRAYNPKSILELGGGIGTLSYAALKNSDAFLDIYEHDSFCLGEIKKNLSEFAGRYALLPDYLTLPPKRSYDLIIIDGGKGRGGDKGSGGEGGFPSAIAAYIQSLNAVKLIVIEGERKSQRFWAVEALRARFLYTPKKYIDRHNKKKGSLVLRCTPCNKEYKRLINHAYWRKKIY